jgi:hypothetical protein
MKHIIVVLLIIVTYFFIAELICYFYRGKSLPMKKHIKSEEFVVEGQDHIVVLLDFKPTEYSCALVQEPAHHHKKRHRHTCHPHREDSTNACLVPISNGTPCPGWGLKITWDVQHPRKIVWEAKNYSG